MNTFITIHECYPEVSPQYMNIATLPPLFGANMQLGNEFHLQPNSCFAEILDKTRM